MSILGDGLMSALDTGRNYLQNDIRAEEESKKADLIAQRQETAEVSRDDRSQKRAMAVEQLKELFARNQSEDKYKRLQSEGEAIEQEAQNIDFKRSSGLMNSIRNSVSDGGEFAGAELKPEDIATIRSKMSPADAEKFYGIKPQTALSVTDDQIAAAKNVGAYESRPALLEQRKQLADTDKQDRKQLADTDKADRLEKKNDELARIKSDDLERKSALDAGNLRIKEIREDTRLTEAQKVNKAEKVMTLIDGQRKEIASESAELHKEMAADLKNALDPKDKVKVKAEYQPRLNELAKKRDQLNKDFSEIRGAFGLSPIGGSTPPSNPLGAPIGKTPDGRNVYMKDGKKVVGK